MLIYAYTLLSIVLKKILSLYYLFKFYVRIYQLDLDLSSSDFNYLMIDQI